jgi:hypothetical protein
VKIKREFISNISSHKNFFLFRFPKRELLKWSKCWETTIMKFLEKCWIQCSSNFSLYKINNLKALCETTKQNQKSFFLDKNIYYVTLFRMKESNVYKKVFFDYFSINCKTFKWEIFFQSTFIDIWIFLIFILWSSVKDKKFFK